MKTVSRLFAPLRFGVFLCATVACASGAFAGAEGIRVDQSKDRRGFLSEVTYRRLETAQGQMGRGEVDRAFETLDRLLRNTREPFERAVILRTYGNLLLDQGQEARAIPYFEDALRLDELSIPESIGLLYNLAQLHASIEQFQEALDFLALWRPMVTEIPAEAHLLAAAAYSYLKRYAEVVPEITQAIQKSPSPNEQWYQLLFAMHVELNELPKAIEVMKRIVALWPAKSIYWRQLASLLSSMDQEQAALAVYEFALEGGHLTTESDILNLVSLYMNSDVPLKAALLLERKIEQEVVEPTLERRQLLGNAWLRAQETEKAIATFREATAQHPDAKLDLLSAQLLMDLEEWGAAVAALQHLIESPNYREELDNPGMVFVLMGSALFEAGDPKRAKESFVRGLEFPAVRSDCRLWIESIEAIEHAEAATLDEDRDDPGVRP